MRSIFYIVLLVLSGHFSMLSGQNMSTEKALEDVDQFQELLEEHAAYLHMRGYDYKAALKVLRKWLKKREEVTQLRLQWKLQDILGEFGDRHARVIYKVKNKQWKRIPFRIAPVGDKVIALRKKRKRRYEPKFENYPFLAAIEGIPVDSLLPINCPQHRHAPAATLRDRQLINLGKVEKTFLRLGIVLKDSAHFTFSNGESDTTVRMQLADRSKTWKEIGNTSERFEYELQREKYGEFFDWMGDSIAYIALPEMFGESSDEDFYERLPQRMFRFIDARALIIDIRGNGGGKRDLIAALLPYFMHPDSTPRVLNLGRICTKGSLEDEMRSMRKRYLFQYESERFDDRDRAAIDRFMTTFKPVHKYDEDRFSPFF
ncbi:MAG: S41 family peptidase, partial [Bacteroidota bacterium]